MVGICKEGPPSESVMQFLTGRGIDDFPTRKSARSRLERFWKEQAMERKTKRGADEYIHPSRSDGHAGSLKVDGVAGEGATIRGDRHLVEKGVR